MTSDTGAVARIVDGLREIVERLEADIADFSERGWLNAAGHAECDLRIARECLAVAEAQR